MASYPVIVAGGTVIQCIGYSIRLVCGMVNVGVGAFTGKTVVETMLMLPLVLPPTVVGFLLLILLGKKVGSAIWWSNGWVNPLYSRGGLGW
ncbi:ABC-type molybdate transport system permease subunit [Paenibacillus brasilensis]|uniref:ABC-type molybdate transport system permease subunit n=1 Tax=Paenibacillus brasilensis TaxID=128574 RepID=A0ABU0L5B3_9BACL|nr:ABC-type molybdate transport system permease subunit [Paenibacillus brasilensis]